jgi:hypothetical protein
MAYTSDFRVKNLIKMIDGYIRKDLSKFNLEERLYLRIFDESYEDKKLWENGGLSFVDPNVGLYLGSNDAGWSIDNKIPLVIIEGTFGTERGQFGDGQLNRASHSLGVGLNGYIGVTLTPFKGQSFKKGSGRKELLSKNINFSYANVHKSLLYLGINFSKKENGKVLFIDAYDIETLKDLVVNSVLKYFKKPNKLDEIFNNIIKKMESTLGEGYSIGARSDQVISNLYFSDGKIVKNHARIFTHNFESLTTSTKRDGHGLLGKNLINIYSTKDKTYAIFIRLDYKDVKKIANRNSKEFNYLSKNQKVELVFIDDLTISDKKIEKVLLDLKDINLHSDTQKKSIKLIRDAFNKGVIKIIR